VDVAGFDALAYLLPGGPDSAGRAVLVTPSGELDVRELSELRVESAGPVRSYLTASRTVRDATETKRADAQATWRGELDRLCDWAGPTMRDLLDHPSLRKRAVPRLGLIPCGVLGTVPWHAARLTEGAPDFAGQRAFISYAATGRQLVENASRPRARVDGAAVLVGNPGGDLTYTAKAVEGLRDHLYPTASVYGVLLGRSDGLGTPEQILEWMPGSSETSPAVLHLGCHARVERDPSNSHLELARADPADGRSRDHLLSVGRVLRKATGRSPDAAGGLVVLSSCASDVTDGDHDEALTLTTAFLAAGARGVIGSRWVVRDVRTAIFMFVFHTCLRADPADPAAALRTTQAWMLDPVREVPAGMPRALCEELRRTDPGRFDPADIESWAAFAHHGC
jgi:hypothetical protein